MTENIPGTTIPLIDNLSKTVFTEEYVYAPIKSFTITNEYTRDKYIQPPGKHYVAKREFNGTKRILFPYRIIQLISTVPYTTALTRDLKPEEIIVVFEKGQYEIEEKDQTEIVSHQLMGIPLTELVKATYEDTYGYSYSLNQQYDVEEYFKFQRAFYHKYNKRWKEECINHWNKVVTNQIDEETYPNGI